MLICKQKCYLKYELFIFVKIISIPDEELFSERSSGAPLHTLSKLYDVPFVLYRPPPSFEAVYCFIGDRRLVTVAGFCIICVVLPNFSFF